MNGHQLLDAVETTDVRNKRARKKKAQLTWGSIIAGALASLGGTGYYAVSKAEAVAVAKVEERVSHHDKELSDIKTDLNTIASGVGEMKTQMAVMSWRLGVPMPLPVVVPPAPVAGPAKPPEAAGAGGGR